MTAALMLYAAVTSSCVAVAAIAAEALARQAGRTVRWVWAAALAAALALAALAPWRQPAPHPVSAVPLATASTTTTPTLDVMAALPRVSPVAADFLRVAWLAASAMLALVVVGVHVRYRRLRNRWPAAIVDGSTVLVSPRDGPAVMGLRRPDIVVPRWFLSRDRAAQAIVVRHEREHLRAGDHRLLAAATLAAVAMPWNPAVWWMLSRLRLAVELDCDARVLRAGTTPHVYGSLLIDVAALSAGRAVPSPALLNPPSNLRRRLVAMHPDRIRFPRTRASAAAVVALSGIVVACNAVLPTDADVASLDAEKAARAAHLVGGSDSVVYVVDGVLVSEAVARTIKADQIARTEIIKVDASRGGKPTAIHIDTRRAVEEKLVAAKAKAAGAVKTGPVKVVGRQADGADSPELVARRNAEMRQKLESFTGVLIIDGVIVDNAAFAKLPRLDIASVEVFKGEAGRKLYGDRAAAGVIQVTTKK